MSLPLLTKIGMALGAGGLVYWAVSTLVPGSAASAAKATGATASTQPTKPTQPSAGSPTKPIAPEEISGTTNAADGVWRVVDGRCYDFLNKPIPCGIVP